MISRHVIFHALRESLHGKTAWPNFLITTKLVENILAEAAKGDQQQQQQPVSRPLNPQQPQQQNSQQQELLLQPFLEGCQPAELQSSPYASLSLQHLYQHLCAAVLLDYTLRALSLPDADAWSILSQYSPEDIEDQQQEHDSAGDTADDSLTPAAAFAEGLAQNHRPSHHQQQQQSQSGALGSGAATAAAAVSAPTYPSSSSSMPRGGAACVVTDISDLPSLLEAAVMDEDGDVYEDMGPPPHPLFWQQHQQQAANTSTHSRQKALGLDGNYPHQQQQQANAGLLPHFSPSPPAAAGAGGALPDPLWPAIQCRLLSLVLLLADYSLLSQEQLWQASPQGLGASGGSKGLGESWGSGGGGAGQAMLQLIRACGVHPHAQELQPAVNVLVSCLVDRLKAAPGEMGGMLGQLWEALGLTTTPVAAAGAGVGMALNSSSRGRRRGVSSQHVLGTEQVLGFSCVLGLWQQLPGPGVRAQLWRQVHSHLLPALDDAAEQLAYAPATPSSSSSNGGKGALPPAAEAGSSSSSGGSSMNGKNVALSAVAVGGSRSSSAGELLSHVLLVCGVVEVYVRGAPAGVDVGQQLTSRGILRSLTLLFAKHSGGVAAAPLR